MTDKLVFNNHSLPCEHLSKADELIPSFLKICIEAKNAGLSTILVDEAMDQNWFRLEIAPHYFMQDWYQKNQTGRGLELARAFRSVKTQKPFFNTQDINNGSDLFEVTYKSNKYSAITAAAWHMAPLVSFNTSSLWGNFTLKVSIKKIDIITEELQEEKLDIKNYYNYEVFQNNLSELLSIREATIQNGRNLVEHAKEQYLHVIFCGKAQEQLLNWSARGTIFEQVKRALFELNVFSEKWQNKDFLFYSADNLRESGLPYRVSGESESVHNNSSLKKERTFYLPSGIECFFNEHIKLSNGYRLHFYPNNEDRKIYVGYIGPHLKLN